MDEMDHAQDKEMRKKYNEQRVKRLLPALRKMFEELDVDNSGNISMDEMDDAPEEIKEELEQCLNVGELEELFEVLDVDGSGGVNIEEFCDGIVKLATSEQPLEFTRIMKQF